MRLAAAQLAGVSVAAFAQEQADTALPEVTVTAQKRAEDLQSVPLSIQALNTKALEDNHVSNFLDYAKLLPSVTFQDGVSGGGNGGPGFARVYMRGVASGGDGNHSASQPSVGMYLDEQPITTIQGSLDVHIYDIARVEALAGPQGTLYGASSQAGTIRIITNKPDPSGFDAAYNVEGSLVSGGTQGGMAEGFVNLPLASFAALRIVGWVEHDPGFIDNVRAAPFTYSNGVSIDNADRVEDNYNDSDIYGARAALKVDLNDSWTITPSVIAQHQKVNGVPGFNPAIGDLKVAHYLPEHTVDSWYQAAMTVEGKISNLDLVYSAGLLKRFDETQLDYTDYSIAYDSAASYFVDDSGAFIDPSQYIVGKDGYQKWSHELRVSTPQDYRFRGVLGLFLQRQMHNIEQNYLIGGLAESLEVSGWPDTWWLTKQQRVDRDRAVFTELSYDITPKLTTTGGIRFFKSENSLQGFFGFGPGNPFAGSFGEALCEDAIPFKGAPCSRLNKTVEDSGSTGKVNVTYRFDDNRLAYVTWSRGFRPGGVNRNGAASPLVPPDEQVYSPDFLTNYEVGWKTSWLEDRLRFNGALFVDYWKDFQFSFLAANSVTVIDNVGQARIKGVESSLDWAATPNLRISGSMALYDAELTVNYCADPAQPCEGANIQSPSGTQLPVTPKIKGNVSGRYRFNLRGYDAFTQASVVYQGDSWGDLRLLQRGLLGEQKGFATFDVSAGVQKNRSSFELFVNNAFDERGTLQISRECDPTLCGANYVHASRPRTIGVKFGQTF